MVREWDPRTASPAEVGSVLDMLNAVLEADQTGDPPWVENYLREYLSEVMPGERRLSWIATDDGSGDALGTISVLLLGDIGDWWAAILTYNDVQPYAQDVFRTANEYGSRSRT